MAGWRRSNVGCSRFRVEVNDRTLEGGGPLALNPVDRDTLLALNQDQRLQLRYDGRTQLRLETPWWMNEGVYLQELLLEMPLPAGDRQEGPWLKQLRSRLQRLNCQIDRRYLTALISRTLSGGGLSELQIRIHEARVEISGVLLREGKRTSFWIRGFLYEDAGPHGGVVFYDIRFYGRPGLPAPALIPLLVARTGRQGPVRVAGCVTLEIEALQILLRWALAAGGWKIPSAHDVRVHQIEVGNGNLSFVFASQARGESFRPLVSTDPLYPLWEKHRVAEQQFFEIEDTLGRGEYGLAIQRYEEEMRRLGGHPFVRERLMQLYIAAPQEPLWEKAYRLAEETLRLDQTSIVALNCLAQYAEGIQDTQMASHYYIQMGEVARQKGEKIEAALSFGKAAELLEMIDPAKARTWWQQTRQEDPTSRLAIAALARHALKTGNYKEAEAVLLDLIEQTPASLERARHHLSLAGLYRSRFRDLVKARQQLEFTAPFLSEDLAYLRELAEFHLAKDENLEALRLLDRLLERTKLLNQAALRADLFFRTGQILEERLARPGSALRRYRQALLLRPDHAQAAWRVKALEAARIQEEDFSSGRLETLSLQIEEKERQIARSKELPASELAQMYVDLARMYWKQQSVDASIQQASKALLLQASLEPAWRLLEEICVQTNRQTDLAALHREMAQKALFDLDAIRFLEEALRLLPSDQQTYQQLSQRYQKLQQWEKLDTLYKRWIETLPSSEVSPLWLQKAQILEMRLSRRAEAEIAYLQAYQNATSKAPYLQALLSFYIQQKDWDKLDLQIEYLASSVSADLQAQLYIQKGQILSSLTEQHPRALEAFKKALRLQPTNLSLLQITIDFLRELQQFKDLLPLLEELSQQTQSPEEAVAARLERAQIYEEKLQELVWAQKEYQSVLALAPGNLVALKRLATLYEHQSEWRLAVETWRDLLSRLPKTPAERRLQILERMLALYARLEDLPRLQETAQAFLALTPAPRPFPAPPPPSPQTDLASLYFEIGQRTSSAPLLAQAYLLLSKDTREIHPAALLAWDAALAFEPLRPDLWRSRFLQTAHDQRPELWRRLAHSVSQNPNLPQLSRLFEFLQESLSLEDVRFAHRLLEDEGLILPQVSRLLASLLEENDLLDEALSVRQTLLQTTPPSPERTALQLELAIQLIRLTGDREAGRELLWEIVVTDPSQQDAFVELQQTYEEDGDLFPFLAKTEEIFPKTTPGFARADLFLRAFPLFQAISETESAEFLSRLASAIDDDPPTLRAIAVAFEELNLADQALPLYERIGFSAPKAEALQALHTAASLLKNDPDRLDQAIPLYQHILSLESLDSEAFQALCHIYESLWMWEDLASLLQSHADSQTDGPAKSAILVMLADLYLSRLEDQNRALDTYRLALRFDPKNASILRALQTLYEDIEDWQAVVSSLRAQARLEADPTVLYEIYLRSAELLFHKLARFDDAEEFYQKAATQAPHRLEPLQGLLQLYEANQRWDEYALASARLALFQWKKQDQEGCRKTLQSLQTTASEETLSQDLDTIVRSLLLEQQESAETARRIFDLLHGSAASAVYQPPLTSVLYRDGLIELSWLLRAWQELHDDPQLADLLQGALSLSRSGDWKALLSLLKISTSEEQSQEERASIALAIAEIAYIKLRALPDTLTYTKEAASLGVPPERILPLVRSALPPPASFADRIAFVRKQIPASEHPRAFYHLASTALLEASPKEAFFALLEASCSQAEDPALRAVLKNFQALEAALASPTPPADPTTLISPRLPDVSRTLLLAWLKLRAGDTDASYVLLDQVLSLESDHLVALRLLGAQALLVGDLERASFLLYRFLELEWDRLPFDEATEICFHLAEIAHQQHDADNALFYLEQANQFLPEDPRLLPLHLQVLHAANLWGDMRNLLQSRIQKPEPTDDIAQLYYELGRLLLTRFQQVDEARAAFEKALHISPLHEEALKALHPNTRDTASDLPTITNPGL